MTENKKRLILLSLIFLIAHQTPPGLNYDKAAFGYNAYCLLETGRDEFGQKFPLCEFGKTGRYQFIKFDFRNIVCYPNQVRLDPTANLTPNSMVITDINTYSL
jgi:hypothetical protein